MTKQNNMDMNIETRVNKDLKDTLEQQFPTRWRAYHGWHRVVKEGGKRLHFRKKKTKN